MALYPQSIFKGPERKEGPDLLTLLIPAYFILAHLLIMIVVVFLVTFIMGLATGVSFQELASGQEIGSEGADLPWYVQPAFLELLSGGIYSFVQILLYQTYLRDLQKHVPGAIRYRDPEALEIVTILPLTLGCLGVAVLWFEGLFKIAEWSPWMEQLLLDYENMSEKFTVSDHLWLSALTGSILIPIAEELLFRGIIFTEFRRAFKPWLAILLNGLLFAVIHWNLPQAGYVFVAGCVFAAAYYWSDALWLPIVLHMVYNFFGSDFSMIFLSDQSRATWFSYLEIAMIPFAALSLYLLYRKYQKRHADVPAT